MGVLGRHEAQVQKLQQAGVAGVALEHSRQAGAFRTQGIVENLAPHCGGAIIPVSLPLFKPKRPGGVGEPVAGCPAHDSAVGVNIGAGAQFPKAGIRSEEHTSELQSLMRNSYAVFCLKKKKTKKKITQ